MDNVFIVTRTNCAEDLGVYAVFAYRADAINFRDYKNTTCKSETYYLSEWEVNGNYEDPEKVSVCNDLWFKADLGCR